MPIFTLFTLIDGRPFLQVSTQENSTDSLHQLQSLPGAYFQQEAGWLLPYQPQLYETLASIFPGDEIVLLPQKMAESPLDEHREVTNAPGENSIDETAMLQLTEQLMIREYSHRTIKSYRSHFRAFLSHMVGRSIESLAKEDFRQYLSHQARNMNWSESTINQAINTLKCYYEFVLGQERNFSSLRPQVPQYLPEILSEEEVERFLHSIDNIKHKAVLSLIYAAGLRLSESVNIRLADLYPEQGLIRIKASKGRQERYVSAPLATFALLQQYLNQFKPKHWLFEGLYDERYSPRTVQSVFRQAILLSQSNPYSTVQTLRHSYAFHLLKQGLGLAQVQILLGHATIKSTERYRYLYKESDPVVKMPFNSFLADSEPGIRYVA